MKEDSKKVFEYVEIDRNTPIQSLRFIDQIRSVLNRVFYNPASQLETDDEASISYLTLKANLIDFFIKATKPIRAGKYTNVVMHVSSKFSPVLKEVITSPRIKRFYKVTVTYPKLQYDIEFFYTVRMEVR